ncbi:HNH endonuclease [Marinomonas communis]|uniref:HNH domain-containing protein n=1 Tax=Marinomonas communis TaxID=28254 RepID=A0A4R6XCV2_9GAMM|nr:HNH endonuclease [Marinomonas communis]TDR15017.1 hypothetical protein C8D85_0371 [Marinomonas communis]
MNYSIADIKLILKALKQDDIWGSSHIYDIKKRLKEHLLHKGGHRCCYCLKSFFGEFSYVIDIEHILPKRKYRSCIFDIVNLSLSCKRCNMKIKRDDVSFLNVDLLRLYGGDKLKYFRSHFYNIVHPNLDDINSHISMVNIDVDFNRLVKYKILNESRKGKYTYEYFKLKEFEIDSFDSAQGLSVSTPNCELSARIKNILLESGV